MRAEGGTEKQCSCSRAGMALQSSLQSGEGLGICMPPEIERCGARRQGGGSAPSTVILIITPGNGKIEGPGSAE